MPSLQICAGWIRRFNKWSNSTGRDRTNDREVVAMSADHSLKAPRGCARRWLFVPALLLTALGTVGCASVAEDVDAYYRQMAYNWRESGEKAKVDEVTLKGETNAYATTGEFHRLKRTKRELERVKNWEDKCEKQANRFEKAAVWTEAHFHLDRPPIPDGPPNMDKSADGAVLQASGVKSP
jgi:hypothetical protein